MDGFAKCLLKVFLVAVVCCAPACGSRKKVRAPFFAGEALPTPPRQNAAWSHGDDALSKAAATLFEQGLPNPQGLEYWEIEIAVGNPWDGGGYPVETHGWILPDDGKGIRFAIAWNGLIYPVVRVGKAANLRKDWAPNAEARAFHYDHFADASEKDSIDHTVPTPLKIALLLRLGEVETATRLAGLIQPAIDGDQYRNLAYDWTWLAFERAICAHERGDDRLALMDARFLSRMHPLIEAELRRRGFPNPSDQSDSHSPDGRLPYLQFLQQLPVFLSDCERRVSTGQKQAPAERDIARLIDDLQNVEARQQGQPGGVSLASDPRVQALVKRGNEAVEPLLEAMVNDRRLTRSVSFGRDFFRSRHLISVSQAAYAALTDTPSEHFEIYDPKWEPSYRREVAAKIRSYWAGKVFAPPELRKHN